MRLLTLFSRTEKQRNQGRIIVLCFVSLLLSSCGLEHEKPSFTYMPDMAYQPAVKAQTDQAMRLPVAGTVSRDATLTVIPEDADAAGRQLHNPLKRTKAVLEKGREKFNIYCAVCHGPLGEGNGSVVPKFPQPPTLQSDKIRDTPDGKLFHIMSRGQNLMPSYATQLDESERWAVAHYIRALYRAKHPTAEDLRKAGNE